jgi:hypothetical protein
VDNVSIPLTAYSKKGNPRGGPGVADVEGGPRPGNRVPVTARAEDPAGAALNIISTSVQGRARLLREVGQPVPQEVPDRTSMRVQANRTGLGQSPLWNRRARNTARGR